MSKQIDENHVKAQIALLQVQAFEVLVSTGYGSREAAKFLGLPWDDDNEE